MDTSQKEQKIEELFKKGILVNEDFLPELDSNLLTKIDVEGDLLVLNEDYAKIIEQPGHLIDWYELDMYRVEVEKERDDELYQSHLQDFRRSTLTLHTTEQTTQQSIASAENDLVDDSVSFSSDSDSIDPGVIDKFTTELTAELTELQSFSPSTVQVIISYKNEPRKYLVSDFTNFFVSRYRFLENILRPRQELQNAITINRVLQKKEKETVSIIGLVESIGETRSGNIIITIEDLTGKINVLISKNKKDIYADGKDLVVDEVIGISGVSSDKIIFADNIVWPDIPQQRELKKGTEEEYVIFLSDIHVGSKLFLAEEFDKFLRWINGELGNAEQKAIAAKIKYIFIAGDLVDGVGIYPSQEEELAITNIEGQYDEFVRLIKKIPADKQIIMCPGNHDVVHLAEPQPVFYQEFAPGLFSLPNVTLVTNPSLINIGKTESFEGFNVLMYHGYSFDYYVANVESIRTNGGYHRSDLIMKFLLKRRHLAPSFKSTPYYPSHKEDPLLIKTIPDFFITGHIHYSSVANYRGVTMISGSCWQGKTTFQEKLGHEPEPARIPLVNLKTREVKILRFG